MMRATVAVFLLTTVFTQVEVPDSLFFKAQFCSQAGVAGFFPAVPRAGRGVADAGQLGSRLFLLSCQPVHLVPPLSSSPGLRCSPPTVAALLWRSKSSSSMGILLQALGPCRLTLWSSRTLLRHPLHHGELPVVPLEWMSPHFSAPPGITQAALFTLCSDSAEGMASQLGVTFLPRGRYISGLGKGWAGSTGVAWAEAEDATKHNAQDTPKCPPCQGRKALSSGYLRSLLGRFQR